MTAEEILKLVEQMRIAQKNYFKTKSKEWLSNSIAIESRVDKEIIIYFSNNK